MRRWATAGLSLAFLLLAGACSESDAPSATAPASTSPQPASSESAIESGLLALAAANDGREAGWILLDDLIADPGLAAGDAALAGCAQAVELLGAISDPDSADIVQMAGALVAAEVNLSAGAESCRAVEGVVRVSHALLSEVAFEASGAHRQLSDGEAALASELREVLALYSAGELCR